MCIRDSWKCYELTNKESKFMSQYKRVERVSFKDITFGLESALGFGCKATMTQDDLKFREVYWTQSFRTDEATERDQGFESMTHVFTACQNCVGSNASKFEYFPDGFAGSWK